MKRPQKLATVVIASLCDESRIDLIKRACESVRAMAAGLDYSILVVANGNRVSENVLDWMATRPDIRVVRLRSGSFPLARRVGAELAEGEFVSFLDDDDEFIPDTLPLKIDYFRQHPECDVLIADGFRISGSSQTRVFPPPENRSDDLVETMMRAGWGACALMLRAQKIDLKATFDPEFRQLEWTLTAFQLARRYQIGYLDVPTYRYYDDTPDSLSKSPEHLLASAEAWRRLSKTFAGTRYDLIARRRYGRECHYVSREYLRQGKISDAWRLHGQSLLAPGGIAFAKYSARLLLASFRRLVA